MMQLHKIFENPKKAFCFFCFAIIILFAAYRSVNGFFYGGGYQWQETRQTANMAEEVSLSELYGADYESYPFGINDSTAAVFCTESIGDTMKEEKTFCEKSFYIPWKAEKIFRKFCWIIAILAVVFAIMREERIFCFTPGIVWSKTAFFGFDGISKKIK